MEGLGAGICTMLLGASLASLDLKVVVPVRTTTPEDLNEAGNAIRSEEHRTPMFVLVDMDALVWTDVHQFFSGDGKDDMAEDNGTKRELVRQLAALNQGLAIGNFQCSRGPFGRAAKGKWNRGEHKPHSRTRSSPKQLRNPEPVHFGGA
jgi:hypothetical protein